MRSVVKNGLESRRREWSICKHTLPEIERKLKKVLCPQHADRWGTTGEGEWKSEESVAVSTPPPNRATTIAISMCSTGLDYPAKTTREIQVNDWTTQREENGRQISNIAPKTFIFVFVNLWQCLLTFNLQSSLEMYTKILRHEFTWFKARRYHWGREKWNNDLRWNLQLFSFLLSWNNPETTSLVCTFHWI